MISIFSVVLLSSLTLEKLLQNIDEHKKSFFKAFYLTVSIYTVLFLLTFILGFTGSVDSNFQNFPNWFLDALIQDRKQLYISDLIYGSVMTLIFFILLITFYYKRISVQIITISLTILIIIDHFRINNKILRNDKSCELYNDCTFISKKDSDLIISESDQFILENNTERKRVFNLQNSFNEAKTSYYHSSIGGYHGAKIRRYQEIIERNINEERSMLVG